MRLCVYVYSTCEGCIRVYFYCVAPQLSRLPPPPLLSRTVHFNNNNQTEADTGDCPVSVSLHQQQLLLLTQNVGSFTPQKLASSLPFYALKKYIEKRHQVQTGPILRHSHHRQQQQQSTARVIWKEFRKLNLCRLQKEQHTTIFIDRVEAAHFFSAGSFLWWRFILVVFLFEYWFVRMQHSTSVERGGCGERRGKSDVITILPLASAWPLSIPIRIHYTLYLSVSVLCLSMSFFSLK